MIIPSSELKSLLKTVSSAKSEQLVLTAGGLVSQDSDLTVCAASDKFKDIPHISVNARKFSSVVNRMSGQIDITPTGNMLVIKSGKARVEMEYMTPKPRVFTRPGKLHTLPLGTVRDLLKYVSVAADPNKAAAQGGVVQFNTVTDLIEDKATALEAMATDTKRCAYSEIPVEMASTFKYTIPLPAVSALQSLQGESIQIGETDSFYYISGNGATIYANKLSKAFPDYKGYLPKSYKFTSTLNSATFKAVLDTVEPMTQEEEQFGVIVHFLDGLLNIRTVGNGGVAEDEMEYEADPLADVNEFKIKVNHKFLSDFASVVTGDIVFNGNSHELPVVLEAGAKKMMIAPVKGGA